MTGHGQAGRWYDSHGRGMPGGGAAGPRTTGAGGGLGRGQGLHGLLGTPSSGFLAKMEACDFAEMRKTWGKQEHARACVWLPVVKVFVLPTTSNPVD